MAALSDRYAIQREIGHGGMATVYLAEDLKHRRQVALKVLRPELAASLGPERFFREIEVAARLQHPHILPLHDSGRIEIPESGVTSHESRADSTAVPTRDSRPTTFFYYVMPFVDGETLRARLARVGELPVQEALRILTEVTDALAYAHGRGVVHRDMKPDNVMISGRHALVMDFGVAKALSDASGAHALTSVGVALGTPAYMAPEQAAADPLLDHRVDIYALGIMAYELLTGRPPFIGMSTPQILAAHVTQLPDPLLVRRPACPPALATVVMKCLEKRPADRWQSAEELLHQLEAVGTPTSGSIPTSAVSAVVTSLPGAGGTAAISNPTLTPVAASGGSWRRAGYLVLGVLLAMLAAWGVMRPRAVAPPAAARRIVVLPFENQGDSSRLYFANGVTEAITAQLTNIAGLSVIPRSTAARYRGSSKSLSEIGKELGVGYVLEGTVQFEEVAGGPPRVRISPELIRVSDTSSVWAQGYDGVMTSVFSLYSDVAQKVAGSLAVTINDPERAALDARPTSNAEAYDLYLRAIDYLNRGLSVSNFRYATPMLERAVVLDPDFALAWGRLSETLALAHWLYISRTPETLARAEAAAKKALALQPDLPEAHRAMGSYYYRLREYNKALAEFAIVRQRQPNSADLASAVGYVYRRQGRWDDAITEFRRRVQLDPGSSLGWNDLGETLYLMRRYAEATEALQHGISTTPDSPDCYAWLSRVEFARTGQPAPAQAVLTGALSKVAIGPLVSLAQPAAYMVAGNDTLVRAIIAMTPEAFGRDTTVYFNYIADLYRAIGDKTKARAYDDSNLALLERKLRALPDDYGFHMQLGQTLLDLGRIPEALKEAVRATELLPVPKDVYFGMDAQIRLAKVLAAVGKTREAVEKVDAALKTPSLLSPVDLRLDPDWAPLRSDPEFRRLAGL